jgi:hypothetical protein
MRRIRVRKPRLFFLLLAFLLGAAACGSESGSEPGAGASTTTAAPEASPGSSPTEAAEVTDYEVWFTNGEFLFMSKHEGPTSEAAARTAMELLLEGPSDEEAEAKVESVIPDGTELLDISLKNGVATVDLSNEYESGGGSLSMQMRLAQVVYTLTQFGSVDGVDFRIDGEPVESFSGEGIVLESPQTRKDFEALLPSILVEQPLVGQTVTSPVTIAGTANTFEATVSMRVLDADGQKLKETFTTATCGSGCRGDFSKEVAFEVDEEQPGFVEVYESSAEDGSDIHLIRVPVILAP